MKTLQTKSNKLSSSNGMFIADNIFSFTKLIERQEDTTYEKIKSDVYTLTDTCLRNQTPLFISNNTCLVKVLKIGISDTPNLVKKLQAIRNQIHSLRQDMYEIWSAEHNVEDYESGGIHIADKDGDVTSVLDTMKQSLRDAGENVIDTPCDHNKISMRKAPKFDLNETHLDSFEGMRTDTNGDRKKIWRYLINMSEKDRTTAFCPYPLEVHNIIPGKYQPNLFDDLFKAVDLKLTHIVATIPPANFAQGEFYAIKYLATHVLHAEYGEQDDCLAVINSEL